MSEQSTAAAAECDLPARRLICPPHATNRLTMTSECANSWSAADKITTSRSRSSEINSMLQCLAGKIADVA